MNNISIVGRVTKDVEMSKTANGLDYTRFNVAVKSEFKNANGEQQVDFFTCIAWREIAKTIAKFFKKGMPIGVFGSMNCRNYVDRNKVEQKIWELNVKGFSFIGTFEEKDYAPEGTEPIDDDNDLPF